MGPMTEKMVYAFSEGNKDLKDLLGGKGANLAEMTNLGLPVPPGPPAMPDEPGVPPAPLFPALPVMLPSAMVSLLMDAAALTTKTWLALFALIVSRPAPGPVISSGSRPSKAQYRAVPAVELAMPISPVPRQR